MKKILVTGATGFIGNYVVTELLKNNYPVIASSSSEEKARQMSWFSGVEFQAFNLESFDSNINYFDFFHQPDILIHLAWEGLPNYKAAFHVDINLPRHFSFLQNMLKHGLSDITITGTCFEYGMREGILSEDMPAAPANPYALAKDELRKQIETLQRELDFHFKWVRLFYMYGKGQNPNSLLSQLDQALAKGDSEFNMSGGEQQRDYLPVEKVAEYIVKTALQNKVEGIVNCCSGIPVTVKSLVENYLKEKNKTISLNLGYYPYTDYEAMRFWGDTRKLDGIIKSI